MKKRIYQIILLIIYISLLVFFTIESLKDGNRTMESSNRISFLVRDIIKFFTGINIEIDDNFNYIIRKFIGHFSYFCVLGIVSSLLYFSFNNGKNYYKLAIIHFSSGFIFAFFTEFIFELFTSGRSASFKDVMIDFLGFIFISPIIFYYTFYTKPYNFVTNFEKRQ